MDNLAQQGWQCPICKRVYSPFTMMCYYCKGDTVTSTGVSGTGIDWQKHQSVTNAVHKPQDNNFTSISTGYATYTAEDIRTCDNCKHNEGLPHNNGTMEYSGACKKCIAKDMWEKKNEKQNT